MRKFVVILVYLTVFMLKSTCWGGNIDNVVFTDKEFNLAQSFKLPNGIIVNIYSVNHLDSSALIKDIDSDIQTHTSIQSIKSKIDENRMKNFIDEEIILSITNTNMEFNNSASSKISLLKQITWWNNTNDYSKMWYAYYTCHAADMFVYIISGQYYIYRFDPAAYSWEYLWTLSSGHVGTWTSYGNSNIFGYVGIATMYQNKAHIVMNFYTAN